MERYFQPEIECASREQIRAWQDERLVKTVAHVYKNVPYYRNMMKEKGVEPGDIQSVDDLHKLPFLTKDDLRDAYPYGLLGRSLGRCRAHTIYQWYDGASGSCFFTHNTILIFGTNAVPVPLLRLAEPRKTLFMYAMVMAFLQADLDSMAAPIKSVL